MADEPTTPATPADTAPAAAKAPVKPKARTRRATGTRTTSRAKAIPRGPEIRHPVALDTAEAELEDRLDDLVGQVGDLRTQLAEMAAQASAGAHELTSAAGRQLARTATVARDNALPLSVGLGIVALLSAILFTRRDEHWR